MKDTGIGIPEDKVFYIFDAFTQVDGSYRRKYQGTGLGLGIVKRLVHLMDGTITIDTEKGAGTTVAFALTLAASEGGDVSERTVAPRRLLDPSSVRLLIAEDNRVNQIMARKSLEKRGFSVDCVSNGQEAISMLGAHSYGCVLLDVQMPIMDGLETTQRIRNGEAGEANRSIPLIALTAHAMDTDRKRFLAAGMDAMVAKPFEIDDLFDVLNQVLPEE